MKQKLKRIIPGHRRRAVQPPRITNDTVAAHREEVLSSARKYIYPLQHSKHRIVLVSTTLFIAGFIGFMSYCLVALYRLHSTSTFLYRVTQVVPFPVAKAGPDFVSYENYLFELRHFMHFYETQQKLDFDSEKSAKQQLDQYKQQALQKIITDAYVKQLARKNKVTVSDREVDDEITILRRQNRLGGSQQAFEDALHENFGWTPDDFKRVIKQRLLEQKVISTLDATTHQKAAQALAELRSGADFAATVAKYSQDEASKAGGGEFGFPVDRANRDLSPATTDALFKLKVGEVSGIVNTGYSLEILKALETNGTTVRGAHVVFNFTDINTYVNDQKDKHPARTFIKP